MPSRDADSSESSVFLSTSPLSSAVAVGDGTRRGWQPSSSCFDNGGVTSRSLSSLESWSSTSSSSEPGDGAPPKHSAPMTTVRLDEDEGLGRQKSSSISAEACAILRAAVPFLIFLVVYGLNGRVPILPRAEDAHCVRLRNVSAFEEALFGHGRAPHLIVSAASCPALDVLSAIPYLMHYLIPVAYPLYVIIFVRPSTNANWRSRIVRFYLLLGWSMWVHYAIWFVLPTAPPWVAANLAAYRRLDPTGRPPPIDVQPREGCAFSRLDRLVGVAFFRTIFSGNPIPFASLPSGHVAWPTCVLLTQMRHGCTRRRRVLLGIYVVWVSWATMYSCHHYMSDIIAAVVVVFTVDRLITCLRRHGRVNCIFCYSCSSRRRVDVARKTPTAASLYEGSCLPLII